MKYLVLFLMVISAAFAAPEGTYSTGDNNPIQIAEPNDWAELVATPNDWDESVILIADIDFEGAEIGSVNGSFSGIFDGQGYTLSNFTITGSETKSSAQGGTGLFTDSVTGTIIGNLNVSNATITGFCLAEHKTYTAVIVAEHAYGALITGCNVINCIVSVIHTTDDYESYTGGIAGACHGEISFCTSSGTVKGDCPVGAAGGISLGGIAGYLTCGVSAGESGSITYCSSTASLTDVAGASAEYAHVGGIAGWIYSVSGRISYIRYCRWTGIINYKSAYHVREGGIVGYVDTGTISDSSAIGTMTVDTRDSAGNIIIGGIVGQAISAGTTIDRSFSDIDFRIGYGSGVENVGGGIGILGTASAATDISNCYAKGSFYSLNDSSNSVAGMNYVGGFIAVETNTSTSTILNCFSVFDSFTTGGQTYKKGFVGLPRATVTHTNCFWDTTSCGFTTDNGVAGVTGKTTAEMQTKSTYSGYDFDNYWNIMPAGHYPILDWQVYNPTRLERRQFRLRRGFTL
jgi:hypothetical protein